MLSRRNSRKTAAIAAVAVSMAGFVVTAPAAGATNIGNEGCTPGYWKNHTDNWQEYRPTTPLGNQWTFPTELASFKRVTFLQALQGGGGPGTDGAGKILMRAATAAYLNAAHEGVGYPYRRFGEPGNLKTQINGALASRDREKMLSLADRLDAANNLGCPLS
jgi:hypothetical protein